MKIKISNLSKSYDGTPVLAGLNLELDDEQPWCLMSPSGSGKTTLFRLLLGLERPDMASSTVIPKGMPPGDVTSIRSSYRATRTLPLSME